MVTRRQFLKLGGALAMPGMGQPSPHAPYKGVAGYLTRGQLDALGASWWYQWDNADPRYRQIANFKLTEPKPWVTEASIQAAAERHDYMLIGNEWTLHGWSWQKQAETIKWFTDLVHSIRPEVQVYASGELVWCPQQGDVGAKSVYEVADVYAKLYGTLPPLAGVHFHSYQFNRDMLQDTCWFVQDARAVYGRHSLLWLTECGDLRPNGDWRQAMGNVQRIATHCRLHGYAWFVSREPGYEHCSLLDGRGRLTAIGQAYREL